MDGNLMFQPRSTGALLARIDLEGCRDPQTVNPGENSRGRLLIAAVEMFATRGYDACSMRSLAEAVGRGAASIYNHYDSKVDLLVASVDYVLSDFMTSVLEGLDADTPPEELLGTMIRRHVLYRATHRTTARANELLLDHDFMVRTMPDRDRERLTRARHEYTVIVRDLVHDVAGVDAHIDSVVRTFALLNLVNESASWYRDGGPIDEEALVEQFHALAERLLGLPPGTLE